MSAKQNAEVIGSLGLDEADARSLERDIQFAARLYGSISANGHSKKVEKESRRLIDETAFRLKKAHLELAGLPEEYLSVLTGFANHHAFDADDVCILDRVGGLAAALASFLDHSAPIRGRPVNRRLEYPVHFLKSRLEILTGREVTIRWNKPSDDPPEPSSDTARALVIIVQSFDASLELVTIFNMIEAVKERDDITLTPVGRAAKSFGLD